MIFLEGTSCYVRYSTGSPDFTPAVPNISVSWVHLLFSMTGQHFLVDAGYREWPFSEGFSRSGEPFNLDEGDSTPRTNPLEDVCVVAVYHEQYALCRVP